MDDIAASWRGRPGPRRQASIWYQLPVTARGILTVIASVPASVAHQPPLVLVSTALRPAMVVFGFVGIHGGWLLALHLTRTPPGGRAPTGNSQVCAISCGLVLTAHGTFSRLVLR